MNIKLKAGQYCILLGLALSSFSACAAEEIEPQADKILQQMSNYLGGLDKFTISSHSTIETMLDSGQKIMLDHDNVSSVRRPDKFYSSRLGDAVEQHFFYNGKTFTIYSQEHNYYATVPAPNTLSATLTMAISQFDLTAPGADLLYKDSYARLAKGLISGFYAGTALINGVECHHLAFRNAEVDWQIWIETGAKPLPRRYVITSRWITGSPQYAVNLNWNTRPDLSDEMFNFAAPKNAEKIDILPLAVTK